MSTGAQIEKLERRMLLAAGDLDLTFNGSGTLNDPRFNSAYTLAVQPADGKIVISYDSRLMTGTPELNFARFNLDGSLDKTFGDGGLVNVNYGGAAGSDWISFRGPIRVQPDGKIIAAGEIRDLTDLSNIKSYFAVTRLLPDGKLDPTFSGDGKLQFHAPGTNPDFATTFDMELLPTGKIVLAGEVDFGFHSAAIQLTPGGSLDKSFDGDGVRLFTEGGVDLRIATAASGDGAFYFGGIYNIDGNLGTFLRRILPDGRTDPAFNSGRPLLVKDMYIRDIAVTAKDQLVLVGEPATATGGLGFRRWGHFGWRDDSIAPPAAKGLLTYNLQLDINAGMTIAPDGKVYVVSNKQIQGGDIILMRFTPDLKFDPTFGNGGIATTPGENLVDTTREIALEPDGNILVGGFGRMARFQGGVATSGAGPGAAIVAGVLTIDGSGSDDRITVDPASGGNVLVKINAVSRTFAAASFSSILIRAGGGNDSVAVSSAITKPATIRGDAGNDTLIGGGGNDILDGGAGADVMKGGAGHDTADYSSRTKSVTVGIGTLADDGEAGEHDNVYRDIENIRGGSGNDTLRGSDSTNALLGNGGDDVLVGGRGADTLDGGPGRDRADFIDVLDTLLSIEIHG